MIACGYVPALALACELAARPFRAEPPLAVLDESDRVLHATERAGAYGVRPGMTARTAAAYCPALKVIAVRPALVSRAADRVADAMADVTPLVEEAEPGVVFGDLRGLQGLFDSAEAAGAAVLQGLPSTLPGRVGIAPHRFTAAVAARRAGPGEVRLVRAEDERAFLAPLPAAWLPFDPDTVERLVLLGIETIEAFAALPLHAVQAQFGTAGVRAWYAACGEDRTPLRPRPFARERVVEHAQAQPPLVSRESIARTVEQLLIRALRHPRAAHRFVRCVRLRATTEDDRLWERTQMLKEPTGDRDRLWATVRPLLEHAEYPGPVGALEVELGGLTAESGRQHSLLYEQVRRREQLDEMVRHMKVRYGQSPLARVVEVEPWSRIPERRRALLDYDP